MAALSLMLVSFLLAPFDAAGCAAPVGRRYGRYLFESSDVLSIQTYEGEYLTVTRVSRVHMGAYLCIANNNVPSPVSRRIMLHVHFPPVIWIPLQLVGAPQRANVTLDCHSEAYPPAVNYWAKDNHKIFLDNEKYSLSVRKGGYKAHMQLSVRQLRERDFGTYRCLSENLLGSTEGSVKLYELSPHSRQQQSLDSHQADRHPHGRSSYHAICSIRLQENPHELSRKPALRIQPGGTFYCGFVLQPFFLSRVFNPFQASADLICYNRLRSHGLPYLDRQ
ncbi:hypothetical protein HPB51_009207 [Rhipicephalus microplus]|uniref:Ig-like domain-containing protein n=1 Tax=Rhipicephalus microplus TaxID=6941 RepID=A0A9J6F0C3_RHIMP|nr:hypothetical protein HPB51_009207 [Rhipicephalus microplus]